MKKIFSKLKNNCGFTLVECVVSIGIFAIMSLMLMMIMSMTIAIKNHNMQVEAGIDDQVENIVEDDSSLTKETYSGVIDFGSAGDITPDGANVVANKVYTSDSDMQIGAIEYDFTGYSSKVVEDEGGESGYGADRVYGAAEIDATQGVKISSGTPTSSSGVYTVTWQIEYNLTAYDASESLKIVLPVGSIFTGYSSTSGGVEAMLITERAVKLSSTYSGSKIVQVTFTLSASDYDAYYKSFGNYMRDKLASTDLTYTDTSFTFRRDSSGNFVV